MGNKPATLCEETASSSYWDLVGAGDLLKSEICESHLEFGDAYPFDMIGTDSDAENVYGHKKFPSEDLDSSVAAPVFRAYLKILMPEMYGIHAVFEQVWVDWRMGTVDDVLGYSFERLSPTTKSLLDGSTTIQKLYRDFMTPENKAAINSIHESNKRLTNAELVEIVLAGQSPVLASGVL